MSVTTPTRNTAPSSSSSSSLLEEEKTTGNYVAEQTILGLSHSITSPDVFAKNSLLSSPLFPRNNNNGQGQPNNESFCGSATEEMMITDEHDQLLQQVSSWIHDLTVVREDLQRASVQNAIALDTLYMTGAVMED